MSLARFANKNRKQMKNPWYHMIFAAPISRIFPAVKTHNGIKVYDDCGSCTMLDTYAAISCLSEKVILVVNCEMEPKDELDLEKMNLYAGKVKVVITIGYMTNPHFKYFDTVIRSPRLDTAMDLAFGLAIPGEAILFSPGTPPEWDEFRSTENRRRWLNKYLNYK